MGLIPESEKLHIVDELLKHPTCPIRPEATQTLTKAQKLDLFHELAKGGALSSLTLSSGAVIEAIARASPQPVEAYGADLRRADLKERDLQRADFRGADLSYA